MSKYNRKFYESQRDGSVKSAQEIVPIVMDLVKPKSVIDVGCGLGSWLSVFKRCGVDDILGLDGEYIRREKLLISENEFIPKDLKHPLEISRRYDLVVSLEVAEHLPGRYADSFVRELTKLGSVILFSAGVPFQGGTEHLNEQWPEYWSECFGAYKYRTIDIIRPKVWNNQNVEWWYKQNIMMFLHEEVVDQYPLNALQDDTRHLSVIHPQAWVHAHTGSHRKSICSKFYSRIRRLF